MKIAFVTLYDARDVNRGSGWPYFLTREIEQQGHVVHYVGPLEVRFPFGTRLMRYIARKRGKQYRSYQDPFTAPRIAELVTQKLKHLAYDVLLTNDYSIAGFVDSDRPIVNYTDAIFPYRYGEHIHPWLDNLSLFSVYSAQRITERGLKRASLSIFPAHYALEEAEKYGIARNKLRVIEWGANICDPPDASVAMSRSIEHIKAKGCIELLFVGKDWQHKGGEMVIAVTQQLRRRGINAELNVVGVDLSKNYPEDFVNWHGFIDTSGEDGQAELARLYSESDVFIMPSQAEGYGLVFAEAAAYGLPSLAYATIGVSTVVKHLESGILLDKKAGSIEFADNIVDWLENPAFYDRLVAGARRQYENATNWQVAVERLMNAVETLIAEL